MDWTEQRRAAYTIIRTENIGTRTASRIFARFPDPREFLLSPEQWSEVGLTDTRKEALRTSLHANIDTEIASMDAEGIRFLLPGDDGFPSALRNIPSPPAALFIRGRVLDDRLAVAVVGTRGMTPYGERSATFFAHELAGIGCTVVSGLAFGVDAAAHRACLDAGGSTAAVLPGGIDDRSIAPQSHLALAERIHSSGGTIVSERAPGTAARPFDYLHRNRIISGLCDAVIVIEGDHGSGALVTARHGLEQGREILAVPGPIWSAASRGTNELIRDGARPCCTIDDVLAALSLGTGDRAKQAARTREDLPATPEESEILDILGTPASVDDLVRRTKKNTGAVAAIVSVLEMKGRIVAVGPKTYART